MDVRLAMTGFGNVGQGVAQLLAERGNLYSQRHGVRLLLTGVADRGGAVTAVAGLAPRALLDIKKQSGTVAASPGGQRGLKGTAFLQAAGADILVEAASTNFEDAEPGWSYTREALQRRMDVVLASKGALVLHFHELFDLARQHECSVLYSATIGAPLPVIELVDRVLVGCRLNGFEGIVNATSNQILTLMAEGASYEQGVRRAQEVGIAETDPTLDVDGWDAAAKVVIIANSVLGASLVLQDVERTGIRGITDADLRAAHEAGQSIRLIARARVAGDRVIGQVGPEHRPLADPLGRLRNEEMGIVFDTDLLGRVATTTQGTGGIPTALTVLRDVVNLVRGKETR